jgi:peptidylprolyl isomerase
MAQMGDPTGTGGGPGSGTTVPAEFGPTPFERGTVGLARTEDPNSGDSQFFIMFAANDYLNGKYTAFGKVTAGMDVVDKIKPGTDDSGMVDHPDKLIKATLGDMQ